MFKRLIRRDGSFVLNPLVAAIYVIFGGATISLIENLIQERISGPTPWLVATILLVLCLIILLQGRVESRIEDLHRRQRLSVQYFAGGSGSSGQAVYREATGLIKKASGAGCRILAVNSFIEVFADSTDEAAEEDRSSYLRAIEDKLGQVEYHRIIQLNAQDRMALSRIKIGDVISKNYGEHYRRVVKFRGSGRVSTGLGADFLTRLDAVPAQYPTSFVLIKTPDSAHLIWQMNEHVRQSGGTDNHPIMEERVRLAGVFIISDPDQQITQHFERWFNELANSVELTAVTADQLEKSAIRFKSNEQIVRDLYRVIDARDWDRLPEFFCPYASYHRPGFPVISGVGELDLFYREKRQVAEGEHALGSVVTEADKGSCRGQFKGTMTNGTSADTGFADYYQFENGKISERWTYFYTPSI